MDQRLLTSKDLDQLEVQLMVDIEDRRTSYKQLLKSCKESLNAIKFLRKTLSEYEEEYYLPDDYPNQNYFGKEDVIVISCDKPRFDVCHHVLVDSLVTINHYQYKSRVKAFWKYVDLLSKYNEDYVDISRLDVEKPLTY